MAVIMYHPEMKALCQVSITEAESLKKQGWVEKTLEQFHNLKKPAKPDPVQEEPIKHEQLAIEENNATIEAQPEKLFARRVGRPRKADDQNVI